MNVKAKSSSPKANLSCFGEGCLYFIFDGFLIKTDLQIKQDSSEKPLEHNSIMLIQPTISHMGDTEQSYKSRYLILIEKVKDFSTWWLDAFDDK